MNSKFIPPKVAPLYGGIDATTKTRLEKDLTDAMKIASIFDNVLRGADLNVACFALHMIGKQVADKFPAHWVQTAEALANIKIEIKPLPLEDKKDGTDKAESESTEA